MRVASEEVTEWAAPSCPTDSIGWHRGSRRSCKNVEECKASQSSSLNVFLGRQENRAGMVIEVKHKPCLAHSIFRFANTQYREYPEYTMPTRCPFVAMPCRLPSRIEVRGRHRRKGETRIRETRRNKTSPAARITTISAPSGDPRSLRGQNTRRSWANGWSSGSTEGRVMGFSLLELNPGEESSCSWYHERVLRTTVCCRLVI